MKECSNSKENLITGGFYMEKEANYNLKIGDLAKRFNVSTVTLKRLMEAGKFPRGLKIGHSYRFNEADITKFEENYGGY